MQRVRSYQRGFTLVELLVVVALTVVVGGVLMSSIRFMYRNNADVFSELSTVGEARRTLEDMLAMIRQATYGADGAYPLMGAEDNRLVIHADQDRDGIVERVEYILQDTVLIKTVTLPEGVPYRYSETPVRAEEVVRNIATSTNPLFTYFDTDGVERSNTAGVGAVRSVQIRISIASSDSRFPEPLTLEGRALLRNVRNY